MAEKANDEDLLDEVQSGVPEEALPRKLVGFLDLREMTVTSRPTPVRRRASQVQGRPEVKDPNGHDRE